MEYQSREMHEGEESRIRDSRRTNALMAMGWTVVGVTNNELDLSLIHISCCVSCAPAFAIGGASFVEGVERHVSML